MTRPARIGRVTAAAGVVGRGLARSCPPRGRDAGTEPRPWPDVSGETIMFEAGNTHGRLPSARRLTHDRKVSVEVSGPVGLSALAGVEHLVADEQAGWLVAVRFRFAEGALSVEVNPDDDTVEVTFGDMGRWSLTHWKDDAVGHDASGHYRDVLGLSSSWRWLLRNQRGYQDGFQIEFGPAESVITLQYLASASRLDARRVIGAEPV